ncbi:MAG: DedA family protein [Deltaproteobacteria bacterium]|nr:DedA family protein [Deltaproteobacteria bacterium]
MHSLLLSITKYSYFEIFIALGLGIVGLPVPDETLMAYAGFLVFQGKLNYLYTILVAFMGTSCGITIGYVLGRTLGNPLIKKCAAKMHVNPDDIHDAEILYNRYGRFALFIGYFIPGVRHLTAIIAGTSLMPYRTFALFAYTGGLLWTITLVSLGYFLGEKWHHVYMYLHRFIIPLVLLSIIVLIIGIYWNTVKAKKE